MPSYMLAFLVVAVVVGVIAVFMAAGHHSSQKARAKAHYVLEPDPTEERRATVLAKQDGLVQEQGYSARGVPRTITRQARRVTFRLGDGSELTLDIFDEDVYHAIVVGEADVLVTRGGYFVGFGRHGAIPMPNGTPNADAHSAPNGLYNSFDRRDDAPVLGRPIEPVEPAEKPRKTWEAD